MFYTLMQRYLWQQLQQLQTMQYQQSQYMAWHYQQLLTWQHTLLSSGLFNQMRWLPTTGVWAAQFAPFSWPFLQYSLHIASQPASTQFAPAVSEPTYPIRDVVAASPTPVVKTIDGKPSEVAPTTGTKADTSTLVVPVELLTTPPQQTETPPPQADIPQPKASDRTDHLDNLPSPQSTDKPRQQPQQASLSVDTSLSADASSPKPTTAAHRKAHAIVPEQSLSEAEKRLHQMQRDNTDLPAPAQLTNIDQAMPPSASPQHLPIIEPISALEHTRQKIDIIDLNQATEAQLLQLAGINRRMAKAIIGYRHTHTAFTHVDELTHVKGIGQATLNKIRHCVMIDATGQRTAKILADDQQQPTQYPAQSGTDNNLPLKPNP